MEAHQYHSNITQKMHGASRNYRYVLDVSPCPLLLLSPSFLSISREIRHRHGWLDPRRDWSPPQGPRRAAPSLDPAVAPSLASVQPAPTPSVGELRHRPPPCPDPVGIG